MDAETNVARSGSGRAGDRRDFLKLAGVTVIGLGGGFGIVGCYQSPVPDTGAGAGPEGGPAAGAESGPVPASEGYILVDTRKCQGCVSCMLACSLVHEGEASLSAARLQIMQNPFEKWPDDVNMAQCRQCEDPACVRECPNGALAVDPEHGNVRRVKPEECVGCGKCVEACPYLPSRPVMVADDEFHGDLKARKCDLCAGAKYHWDAAGGGPGGKQACVEVCPVGAIAFTNTMPTQDGDEGYNVNLRDANWAAYGFPTD